jgi:hypothetical protein
MYFAKHVVHEGAEALEMAGVRPDLRNRTIAAGVATALPALRISTNKRANSGRISPLQ